MYSVYKKLFLMNRITRKLVVRYISKKEKGVWNSQTLRKLYEECQGVIAGDMSYGWNSDTFEGPVTIGKYCSIGPGVRRLPVNHVTTGLTTHPCWFNPVLGWIKKDFRQRTHLQIGHDVWIGANAIILPSVTKIGNGAIIGAGAVVTKNIKPYEIVGGVPAKLIKKRFSDDVIEKVENTQWWNLPKSELKRLVQYFDDPEKFVKILSKNVDI